MNSLLTSRQRVINAINGELSLLSDNQLDSYARQLFGLPPKPDNAPPFVGWLMPESKTNSSHTKPNKTSLAGINLIKQWEGWRARAYRCPAGVWTIGYGHTHTAKRGMVITKKEGERLLRRDLQVYENCVRRLVKVPLNQNQFDALVSFTYNVGRGAFSQSTLLRVLNQGNYSETARQFLRWVHGGGKKLPGLESRRNAERKLFEL